MSRSCKGWRETIRDFLAEEFFLAGLLPWVDRHSLGLNKGLTMDMGGSAIRIRQTSIRAFKGKRKFRAYRTKKCVGVIAIRFDDLLIPGSAFLPSTFPRE